MRKLFRNKKGQGLVEYGILVGGIALVALAATAILGHKTNDLIGTVAASLPGAHEDGTGPIVSGKLVNTAQTDEGAIILDTRTPGSLSGNLGIDAESLIIEPEDVTPLAPLTTP